NIVTLLASMSDLLRRTLGENIVIVTDVVPELWSAFADLNQLDNAILNVAINARDAMEGRGHLIIAARNCHIGDDAAPGAPEIDPGDYVRLAITDTGKGIEQEVLERVFEPFFSTKAAGQGTGLGLSQVYGFIKQTGGHVNILSEPGQGTTVELYVPRAAQDELAQSASDASDEIVRAPGAGATILVVEDDPSVRIYAGEILRELGFFVREAPNARAALEVLRSDSEIDLLFSDIGLPGMNGPELARAALQLRPELKVILATGYARETAVGFSQSLNGALLIAKPFGRAQLAETIRKLLPAPQKCA
ncbi:MAG TPA: ATP-binding protein, partial [Methylovirgula sp.]